MALLAFLLSFFGVCKPGITQTRFLTARGRGGDRPQSANPPPAHAYFFPPPSNLFEGISISYFLVLSWF
jgi:hypothetical protein